MQELQGGKPIRQLFIADPGTSVSLPVVEERLARPRLTQQFFQISPGDRVFGLQHRVDRSAERSRRIPRMEEAQRLDCDGRGGYGIGNAEAFDWVLSGASH